MDERDRFVSIEEKKLQIASALGEHLSAQEAVAICEECFGSVCQGDKNGEVMSIELLADVCAAVQGRITSRLGPATAHKILGADGVINERERQALAEFYASQFVRLGVFPGEVKTQIDCAKRVKGILEEQAAELERKMAEKARENRELMKAARYAGMAEVATTVLHNVGNVLNSLNVSLTVMGNQLKEVNVDGIRNLAGLVYEKRDKLAEFLCHDPRGLAIPEYLMRLSEHYLESYGAFCGEVENAKRNLEHVKRIVAMQQSYARQGGAEERVDVAEVLSDAIRICEIKGLAVETEFCELPTVFLDRHRLLQIVVNLLSNARFAVCEKQRGGLVKVATERVSPVCFRIHVKDNGIGIPRENLTRIFQFGFTTRREGHGFGLHSGALAAREMGGSLNGFSDGEGLGACFTLELPIR